MQTLLCKKLFYLSFKQKPERLVAISLLKQANYSLKRSSLIMPSKKDFASNVLYLNQVSDMRKMCNKK